MFVKWKEILKDYKGVAQLSQTQVGKTLSEGKKEEQTEKEKM